MARTRYVASDNPFPLRFVFKSDCLTSCQNFHLYVPGYVGFFNLDTEDCDHTTFYYWSPGWDETLTPDKRIYLTRNFRQEIIDLVQELNSLVSDMVTVVNKELGSERIHYVDWQPRFDGHRWCEAGDFHEPEPNGKSYFFLSAWPDLSLDGITESSLRAPFQYNYFIPLG
jgi:hypothetical protein